MSYVIVNDILGATCADGKENLDNAGSLELAASSANSQVVYGYDENGQEVAFAIVFDGPFASNPETENECDKLAQQAPEQIEVDYLANQEECVTSESVSPEGTDVVKEEKEISVEVEEKENTKRKKVVRVYKVGNQSGKKKKQVRRNNARVGKMREGLKITLGKSTNVKSKISKKPKEERKKRTKSRRCKNDRTFPAPNCARKLVLPSKHFKVF